MFYTYENDHGPGHVHVFQRSATSPKSEINLDDLSIRNNWMNTIHTRKAGKIVADNRDCLIAD